MRLSSRPPTAPSSPCKDKIADAMAKLAAIEADIAGMPLDQIDKVLKDELLYAFDLMNQDLAEAFAGAT